MLEVTGETINRRGNLSPTRMGLSNSSGDRNEALFIVSGLNVESMHGKRILLKNSMFQEPNSSVCSDELGEPLVDPPTKYISTPLASMMREVSVGDMKL